eukprot:1805375-Amphidinium_carterae.1
MSTTVLTSLLPTGVGLALVHVRMFLCAAIQIETWSNGNRHWGHRVARRRRRGRKRPPIRANHLIVMPHKR